MKTLTFLIEVSTDATDDICGECMFIEYEGKAFCRLFGCETLHVYPGQNHKRTNMCRHFSRSGETVTTADQHNKREVDDEQILSSQ